jgi:hypothetical protein
MESARGVYTEERQVVYGEGLHERDPMREVRGHEGSRSSAASLAAGGNIVEAIGGLGAVILGMLGLFGMLPLLFAALATICLGVALFFAGGSVAARYSRLLRGFPRSERRQVGSGMMLELMCGLGGLVLGVLALLNIVPLTLTAVAAIVLGAGLIFAGGAEARMNTLIDAIDDYDDFGRHGIQQVDASLPRHDVRTRHREARSLNLAAGFETVFGIAAICLGILALLGVEPLTLVLCAMVAMGVSAILSGSALASRLIGAFGG